MTCPDHIGATPIGPDRKGEAEDEIKALEIVMQALVPLTDKGRSRVAAFAISYLNIQRM